MMREPTPSPPEQEPPKQGRPRSRLARVAALLLASLAIFMATVWVFRTQVATTISVFALKNIGYPNASLSVTRLGFRRATIANFVLSPDIRAKHIEATYSLNGILSKRLDSLHITGLAVNSGSPNTPSNNAVEIPLIAVPVDRLQLTRAHATLQTTNGAVRVQVDGDLTRRDNGASDLRLSASIRTDAGDATFKANGVVTTIPKHSMDITAAISGAVTSPDLKASFDGAVEGFHLASGEALARITIAKATLTYADRATRLSRWSVHLIQRPRTGVEVDMTGMLQGDDIPPETKISLALNAPRPLGRTPVEFHAVLDSALGWGQVDGHIDPSRRFDATVSGAYEPKGETVAKASGAVTGRLGEDATFSLSGAVTPGWALSMVYPDASAAGKIALTVHGVVPLTKTIADLDSLIRAARLNGRIDADIADANVPGVFTARTASAVLNFDSHDNAIDITLLQGLDVQGLAMAPELAPASVRRILGAALSLRTPPSSPIRIENAFNNPILRFPSGLTAKAPKSRATLPKGATLRFNDDKSFTEAEFPKITFQSRAVEIGVSPITVAGGLENLHLSPDKASARFHLSGNGTLAHAPASARLRAALSGSFTRRGPELNVIANPDSTLSVIGLTIDGHPLSNTPIALSPDGAATLSIDLSQSPPDITYAAALKPVNALLSFPVAGAAATNIDIDIVIPVIKVSGSTNEHALQLGDGRLQLPAYGLSLNGVNFRAAAGAKMDATLSIATIENPVDTPWFIPLKLQASAVIHDGVLVFKGRLNDTPGNIIINANGRHNFAKNTGHTAIKAKKITFLPTVLQPRALSPRLRHIFREVDGDIALKSDLSWRNGALQSEAEVLVNLARLETDEVSVTNAATIIAFNNLFPPTTAPGQIVDIGEINVGVPLTDGRLTLQLRADGSVLAGLEKFNLFGGRIETAPFVLPRTFDNFTIPLAVTGIRLADLLAVAKFGDLTATGTLDGSIPVTITGGEFAVRGGLLKTVAEGSLRYHPRAVAPALSEANEGAALFLDLVKDFSYDEIQVTLNEGEFEQISFGFKIKGHNKTVYNGVPVDLNVTLTGPLRNILQQGQETFTTPAWLKDRIAEFEQKEPVR